MTGGVPVRRIAWRITLQTAGLFAVCVLLLAAVTAVFTVRSQDSEAQSRLRAAIADEDAVTDPPSGIVVYESGPQGTHSSPALAGQPLDRADFDAVAAGGRTRMGQRRMNGINYAIRTARRGTMTVQAGYDLTATQADRDRLWQALTIVGSVGILLALLVGRLIAARAIRPLGLAIARQQRFVADASHELRTPLTHVHMRAQMIERALRRGEPPGPSERAELSDDAARLVAGTRQLADIVNELLLSAQLGHEPGHRERVDMAEIAAAVLATEQQRADSIGVTLALDAPTESIESSESEGETTGGPYAAAGVPTALHRVVASLVDNALGHTSRDGHVTVSLSREPRRVVASVIDDGAGFDPADSERIFERFARGSHGDGRRFGLGLALVREVVEAHGGTITATSRPGQGATFVVSLPAWPVDTTGTAANS